MTTASPSLVDTLRERYVLERELGRGGMATVYLTEDLKHDRPVALKALRPELAGALGPERVLREIKLTARLDHPHILPVFDSGAGNALGERERAVELLQQAFADGQTQDYFGMYGPGMAWFRQDPHFESLRELLPYIALLRPKG